MEGQGQIQGGDLEVEGKGDGKGEIKVEVEDKGKGKGRGKCKGRVKGEVKGTRGMVRVTMEGINRKKCTNSTGRIVKKTVKKKQKRLGKRNNVEQTLSPSPNERKRKKGGQNMCRNGKNITTNKTNRKKNTQIQLTEL